MYYSQDIYNNIKDNALKKFAADIVSVLAMTMSEERECLKYRLLGQRGDIGDWGHEYVRSDSLLLLTLFPSSQGSKLHTL